METSRLQLSHHLLNPMVIVRMRYGKFMNDHFITEKIKRSRPPKQEESGENSSDNVSHRLPVARNTIVKKYVRTTHRTHILVIRPQTTDDRDIFGELKNGQQQLVVDWQLSTL